MAIDAKTASRLENYKFAQADRAVNADGAVATAATDDERELIRVLAELFGDPGWFEGHMATIIDAAISPLLAQHVPTEA